MAVLDSRDAIVAACAEAALLAITRPAESRVDHCGTGNRALPRFIGREDYHDDRGFAAQTIAYVCVDCGGELVRYSRIRRLAKPKSRLSWRDDAATWREMGR